MINKTDVMYGFDVKEITSGKPEIKEYDKRPPFNGHHSVGIGNKLHPPAIIGENIHYTLDIIIDYSPIDLEAKKYGTLKVKTVFTFWTKLDFLKSATEDEKREYFLIVLSDCAQMAIGHARVISIQTKEFEIFKSRFIPPELQQHLTHKIDLGSLRFPN